MGDCLWWWLFVVVVVHGVRELPIKKMQLNYGILPKGSDPPPRLLELLGHFLQTFGTFGTLSRKVSQKSFTKVLYTKSVPKLLDCLGPPRPLWKKSIIKLHFFMGSSLKWSANVCAYKW